MRYAYFHGPVAQQKCTRERNKQRASEYSHQCWPPDTLADSRVKFCPSVSAGVGKELRCGAWRTAALLRVRRSTLTDMKRVSLMTWIILATSLGIALGLFAPGFAVQLQFISNIFLRLIKSIIAPLIFTSLVCGIAKSGGAGTMGRIGVKAMSYFTAATLMALVVGLFMVNVFRPGDGVVVKAGVAATNLASTHPSFAETIEKMFPRSIIESMANGDVLPIVIFSLLFGIACTAVGRKSEPVVRCCEAVMEVMFKYTHYVIYLAPFGAGAAMAVTVGKNGLHALAGPAKLVGTLYLALIVFVLVVLGLVILGAGFL